MEATILQKQYYERTAAQYDTMHLDENADTEHILALHFLSSMIACFGIKSVLDIGAGTGRTIEFLKYHHPELHVVGIEPVEALRQKGYEKGIPKDVLIDGDGNNLEFNDNAFDLVCEFAVLHHVPKPDLMVGEMLRVSKKAIFISDSNNFGQGSFVARSFKQILNAFGLWQTFNYLRTGGKNYQISEGDGLFYSYSVFDNFKQIQAKCSDVHLFGTQGSSANLYRTASHVALLGIKS
jgi:ubiquinone/menaquinone biosynthesis C-methylase UbiE